MFGSYGVCRHAPPEKSVHSECNFSTVMDETDVNPVAFQQDSDVREMASGSKVLRLGQMWREAVHSRSYAGHLGGRIMYTGQ